MAIFGGESGAREWNEPLCETSAVRLHVGGISFCPDPFAHPQIITSKRRNWPEEQHKVLTAGGVHLAGIVGDNFIEKGGDGPMR